MPAEFRFEGSVTLAPLDMMIAAHAAATHTTLVTRDKTLSRVPSPLRIGIWTESSRGSVDDTRMRSVHRRKRSQAHSCGTTAEGHKRTASLPI
nr:PIN domain-containing protein [Rhodopseudomonas sp. BR0C11]